MKMKAWVFAIDCEDETSTKVSLQLKDQELEDWRELLGSEVEIEVNL